jgi:hypothetical protein
MRSRASTERHGGRKVFGFRLQGRRVSNTWEMRTIAVRPSAPAGGRFAFQAVAHAISIASTTVLKPRAAIDFR